MVEGRPAPTAAATDCAERSQAPTCAEAVAPDRHSAVQGETHSTMPVGMSSTGESLISELDNAIIACTAQSYSSDSSSALIEVRSSVEQRRQEPGIEHVHIRQITAGFLYHPGCREESKQP